MGENFLLLLDFDGTITTKDTFPLFIKYDKGFFVFISTFILFSPLIFLYKLKLYNGGQLKQHILSFLYKSDSKQSLYLKGKKFIDFLLHHKIIKIEFLDKINLAKSNNDEICIVSASPDIWIKPFANKLGVKFICTELQFDTSDLFTGNFKTKNCVGTEKAIRIKQLYNLPLYNKILAYGNSNDDDEMLKLATTFYKIK